jgi:hypothetical protein
LLLSAWSREQIGEEITTTSASRFSSRLRLLLHLVASTRRIRAVNCSSADWAYRDALPLSRALQYPPYQSFQRAVGPLGGTASVPAAWLGVGYVSLTGEPDLTTPTGREIAALSVFAEFEKEMLRERMRAGLAHARRNGGRLAGH